MVEVCSGIVFRKYDKVRGVCAPKSVVRRRTANTLFSRQCRRFMNPPLLSKSWFDQQQGRRASLW